MKKFYSLSFILFSVIHLSAQTNTFPSSGSAGIGTAMPDPSSKLEIKATNRGLLIPRMSQSQRNSILNPATSLLIYQTSSPAGFYYYTGTAWKLLSVSGANTSLSNLASTKVNVTVLPDSNNKRSLGNTTRAWQNIFFTGNIYFKSLPFISSDTSDHSIAIGLYAGNSNTADDNTIMGYHAFNLNTTGSGNCAIGNEALYSNSTGYANIAMGHYAMHQNTTGGGNVALGDQALYNNTTGNQNVFAGEFAGFNNTDGGGNVGIGWNALSSNTTAHDNVANGYDALEHDTAGGDNIAIGAYSLNNSQGGGNVALGAYSLTNSQANNNVAGGYGAMYNHRTGINNVALGSLALYSDTSGIDDVAIGANALYSNSSGVTNVAVGSVALYSNTTGNDNVGIGTSALYSNTSGSTNVAIGRSALNLNSTGVNNIATGFFALQNNTTGYNNAATGWLALNGNSTGAYLTVQGSGADVNADGYSNSSAFGNGALITSSDQVRIGNSSVISIGGYANWTNISDERIKKNIKENVPGLAFINLLKPVTYNYNLDAADKIVLPNGKPQYQNSKEQKIVSDNTSARTAKQQILYTGLIAQDVDSAAKKIGYNFSGVDVPKNNKDLYGLRYADFIVPLIKAVQELSKMNDAKDSAINNLQNEIDELKAMIVSNQSMVNSQQSTVLSSALLQQNIPNPFSNSTTINYSLPQKFSSATIIVTDKNGNALKQINLSAGKGSVTVDASTLASGAYQYSLYVDGKRMDTKQMILTK